MIEKVKVYENKDKFQQLCNCCPIHRQPIKNYKLEITLSNGHNQVLRLCDEHLGELEESIKQLK